MNEIPADKEIPVEILASVFNDTTNSYKFYWFLAILDIIKASDKNEILIDDIIEKMIESVWYPLNYFKLSFGKQDSFKGVSNLINSIGVVQESTETIISQFKNQADNSLLAELNLKKSELARWVPYRFIRPFVFKELRGIEDHRVNQKIVELAQSYSTEKPYSIPYHFSENKIIIHSPWKQYLKQNIGILKGFALWPLIRFVQKHNPNVLGIPEKLFKPELRNLNLNIRSWNFYIQQKENLDCIYSNTLVPANFSLDHFVPWSYTVHDLNWNILPVSKEINSSKSNNLPSLDSYLESFISLQRNFFTTIYNSDFKHKDAILEHYCMLFNENSTNIIEMPKGIFDKRFSDTIQLMVQIAQNLGFRNNWTYKAKF